MEITYEAYRQIMARTRLLVVMDWNPSLNSHWVFDRVLSRSDVLYVHSTYKDNPHLSVKQVAEIEGTNPNIPENVRNGTADAWYWDVYGLGKRGRREGAVFPFFDVVEHWPDEWDCQKYGFGLDFGYSNDPAALIECAIFQGKLYLREWIYETGLITCRSHAKPNTPSIQGLLEAYKFDKNWKIKADCARPEQIAELMTEGYNISAGPKGKGSVIAGIDLIKKFPICVYRGSQNMQMELQQYAWKKHANGTWLQEPEDKWNHLIDAARYWAMDELAGWQPVRRRGRSKQAAGRSGKRY
jgi:phage terminase large subunit